MYASSLAALRRDRGGGLTGLFCGLKVTPGIFLLLYAGERRWRSLGRAVLSLGAVTLLGLVVRPAESVRYFRELMWDGSRVGGLGSYLNQSLLGAFTRAGLPIGLWAVTGLAVTVGGLVLAHRLVGAGLLREAVCWVGLVGVLVSPISWVHHAVWLVPTVGLLLGAGSDRLVTWCAVVVAVLPIARFNTIGARLLADSAVGLILQASLTMSVVAAFAGLFLRYRRLVVQCIEAAPARAPSP